MSHDRYQEDLILTVEDFSDCGWKAALAEEAREGYYSMREAFADAAKQAINEDRQAHGKALWLLSNACSMMLSPDSHNEPFKPFAVFRDGRPIIPDDLTRMEVAFFAEIVEMIDDPWLKARLADLVWLMQSPREVKFALAAIDSYRTIPLDTENWKRDGDKCWQRAINLARLLGAGAGERLAKMEAAIIEAFMLVTRQDGFFGYWLADLLKSNSFGTEHSTTIATKLESLAHEFESEGDLHGARNYFQASADWFKESGDEEKATAMMVAVAEGYVKEASTRLSSDPPSHMAAASFYESAIQTYRNIPRSKRAVHRVDERIAELRAKLSESGKESLDEMGVITSPGVDISKIVEDARNLVSGKELDKALKAFANLHSFANVKGLRERMIESLSHHSSLRAVIPTVFVSGDGRRVAQRPAMGSPPEDDETVIFSEMVRHHNMIVDLAVRGRILPAQEVLLLEHRLREADFVNLARQSPIVPIGRELLFGKALFAGYDRDFITALHILVPQIEHMVRYHLKQAGGTTTYLDSKRIETENGLSTLMDLPKAEKIFGEDLSFEIKALFCDPFGSNLRNELAHGLLDDRACVSTATIYAWWFGLKLVFNTFWNASRNDTEKSEQGEKS